MGHQGQWEGCLSCPVSVGVATPQPGDGCVQGLTEGVGPPSRWAYHNTVLATGNVATNSICCLYSIYSVTHPT